MQIVTFTRSTPDTAAALTVGSDGKVSWGDAGTIVNPWDEYALEEAITQAKNTGTKATVIAIGGEYQNESLKHSLAMGLDEAARVDDPSLEPTDGIAYGAAAAAAVKKLGETKLVLFGKEAVDTGTDQHMVATARKLGWRGYFEEDVVCFEDFPETVRAFRAAIVPKTKESRGRTPARTATP